MPVTQIEEGRYRWIFPDGWLATKYDEWAFYRKQFQRVAGGSKAVDIVALAPDKTLWLIEAKDYTTHPRSKSIELCAEVAQKVRDTLSGLAAARTKAVNGELELAKRMTEPTKIRVVLHLEQPKKRSKLFPGAKESAANLKLKLKGKDLLKAVDAHPMVVGSGALGNVDWTVTPVT